MFKKSYLLLLKLLLLLVSFLCINNAFGQNKFNTHFFIDSSQNQSLSQIKEKHFSVLDENFVYHEWTENVYWIKITPLISFDNNQRIIFSNSYNHYETLYFIYEDDSVLSYTFGANQYNESATYVPSFLLNKNIKEIYLSVKSDTFLYESFTIENNDKSIKEISYYLIFQILILTYLFSLLIYMIIIYNKSRLVIIKKYCFYLFSVILMVLFISNLGKFIIWDQFPLSMSYLESLLTIFLISAYLIFALDLIKDKVNSRWVYNTVKVFLIFNIILNIYGLFFLSPRYLSLFSSISPLVAIILIFIIALVSLKLSNKDERLYFIGTLFFILCIIVRVLINWGIFNYSFILESVVYLFLIIELITFKVVIIRKIEKKIQLTLLEKLLIEEGKGKIVELEKSIEKIEIDSEKKRLIDKVTLSKKINETLIDPLTKREIEVLNELILGGSQEEIANKLFISKSTLKTHIGSVYSKLNVKNRIEAINKAIQLLA